MFSHGGDTQTANNQADIESIKNNTGSSTLKSAVDANTSKNSYPSGDSTKMGHITITSSQDLDVHGTQITTSAIDITGIKNNSLASTLKTAVDANSSKTTYPADLAALLSVSDTYELEIGNGSGIPRLRLNGQNGVATSSEIIFIDATGSNAEYRGGFSIRMNTADNELQFMSDLNNDNNPEECLKIDRATKECTGHKLCVYQNEIECKGTSNKSIMITSKDGGLPGNAGYYPVVKTPFTNMYFATNGAYNAYLGNTNVGQIDFTGQHRCVPNNSSLDVSSNVGKIVISNGVINSLVQDASGIYQPKTGKNAITVNDSIPVVKLCSSYQDKRVFGVISEGLDDDANGNKFYTTGALNSVLPCDPSDNRLYINSVGEGAVWVCNDQGDIQNGDYITTSAISEGYGTKQTDDILHNYTVAKATMSCDFELDSANYECREITYNSQTYRIALIACTYHCG